MSQSAKHEKFSMLIDMEFWTHLEKKKIDEMKLNKDPLSVFGFFQTGCEMEVPNRLRLTRESFFDIKEFENDVVSNILEGKVIVTNTIEEFQKFPKKATMKDLGTNIMKSIISKDPSNSFLFNPQKLFPFLVICFPDIKKHVFHHFSIFPVLKFPLILIEKKSFSDFFSDKDQEFLRIFEKNYKNFRKNNQIFKRLFFLFNQKNGNFENLNFLVEKKIEDFENFFFCFVDSCSNDEAVSCLIKNFAFGMFQVTKKERIQIIGIREKTKNTENFNEREESLKISRIFVIEKDKNFEESFEVKKSSKENGKGMVFLGCEKTSKESDISKSMDPKLLMETSVSLNVKLMKWRMVPSLKNEIISDTKCLLIGAGTLGCSVARNLMSWGFTNITFIDYGKVSFSNPVRQSLFEFSDCLEGGKSKSEAACERLKMIFPSINANFKNMRIPMPGHSINKEMIEGTIKDIKDLEDLIKKNDVIFLLTDTRESRWLPSLIACAQRKLVINSAIGFDSFLVMRHGVRKSEWKLDGNLDEDDDSKNRLGCYFCSEVTSPSNTTENRPLDEQCTVTRPGASAMASAIAVELLVSVLHHPDGKFASGENEKDKKSTLGLVPHQIRGNLSTFSNFILIGNAYKECPCCSQRVVKEYIKEGKDFLLQVFNNTSVLDKLTGLDILHKKSQLLIDQIIEKEQNKQNNCNSNDSSEDGFEII